MMNNKRKSNKELQHDNDDDGDDNKKRDYVYLISKGPIDSVNAKPVLLSQPIEEICTVMKLKEMKSEKYENNLNNTSFRVYFSCNADSAHEPANVNEYMTKFLAKSVFFVENSVVYGDVVVALYGTDNLEMFAMFLNLLDKFEEFDYVNNYGMSINNVNVCLPSQIGDAVELTFDVGSSRSRKENLKKSQLIPTQTKYFHKIKVELHKDVEMYPTLSEDDIEKMACLNRIVKNTFTLIQSGQIEPNGRYCEVVKVARCCMGKFYCEKIIKLF